MSKELEMLIERIAEFVCSHPGNCRSVRLECFLDDIHEPGWCCSWIGDKGKIVKRTRLRDFLDKAIEDFFK